MKKRLINSDEAPPPVGWYSQALEVSDAQRILFVSGQIPVTKDGEVPQGFGAQCRLASANVLAQLGAADMTPDNTVQVTTFLSDRSNGLEHRHVAPEIFSVAAPTTT